MGGNRFQMNPGKTEWLWVQVPQYPVVYHFRSGWGCIAPDRCGTQPGVLLDLLFLLEEQVAVVTTTTFVSEAPTLHHIL